MEMTRWLRKRGVGEMLGDVYGPLSAKIGKTEMENQLRLTSRVRQIEVGGRNAR